MPANYAPGQTPRPWPARGRWSPADLPPWYRKLLGDLAGDLSRWRDEHDVPPRLDPRCDPRRPQRGPQRRAVR